MTMTQKRWGLSASLFTLSMAFTQGRQQYNDTVKQYLTRTYNPDNPTATCYDTLYQSDVNGDAILQNYEYISFIADLSEGDFNTENYLDMPFVFKVNFVYLSCRCKFHPKSIENGGDDCCHGPEAGIYISGAGPHEVPVPEEEAFLQMACADTQGAIEYARGQMTPISTIPPIASPPSTEMTGSPPPQPITDSPTRKPTKMPVSDSPTKQPTRKPVTGSPSRRPTGKPVTDSPSKKPTRKPVTDSPSKEPTGKPVTESPSKKPTRKPVTDSPSKKPTRKPVTDSPSKQPTGKPVTYSPSTKPTRKPVTDNPTEQPTANPVSDSPSKQPAFMQVLTMEYVQRSAPSPPSNTPLSNQGSPVVFIDISNSLPSNNNAKSPLPVVEGDTGDTQSESISPKVAYILGAIFALYAGVYVLARNEKRKRGIDKKEGNDMQADLNACKDEKTEIQYNEVPQVLDAMFKSTMQKSVNPIIDEGSTLSGTNCHSFEHDDDSEVTREDLIAAMEAGNWAVVGAVAAQLVDSTQSPTGNSSILSLDNTIEPFVSSGSDTDTDDSTSALDEMVTGGDWESGLPTTAQLEGTTIDEATRTLLNRESQQQIVAAEVRVEVETLVRRVVPDEIENIDEMLSQFNGKEVILMEMLRLMDRRGVSRL